MGVLPALAASSHRGASLRRALVQPKKSRRVAWVTHPPQASPPNQLCLGAPLQTAKLAHHHNSDFSLHRAEPAARARQQPSTLFTASIAPSLAPCCVCSPLWVAPPSLWPSRARQRSPSTRPAPPAPSSTAAFTTHARTPRLPAPVLLFACAHHGPESCLDIAHPLPALCRRLPIRLARAHPAPDAHE